MIKEYILVLQLVPFVGAIVELMGLYWMQKRFRKHDKEMARKVYETEILREIGERIGYSLDASKIVEIISGSINNLLPYSTVSYMIYPQKGAKIVFSCRVNESVSGDFVRDVKVKMLAAFSLMTKKGWLDNDIDESLSGVILDEHGPDKIKSYFNLPIVILDKPIGLINVASQADHNLYNTENTDVFFQIARQASQAVSKLQEVLENEKARLLRAVESLADGLLMVDTNFELVLVNKKLIEMLGTIAEPTLFDIVNALSGKLDLRSKMQEAITKSEPIEPEEISIQDRALQILVSKVLDRNDEKPIGISVLFHDVTDSKSIEKLRRDFTAMMVHELRSPLTSIKATTEMLLTDGQKYAKEEVEKNLKTIDSTSQSMLEVVNDLLDVSKLEAGKFDVVCDVGKVEEIISERVESVRAIAKEKNLKLSLDADEVPLGYFDKIRIKQVMNNLLSNAFKFTDRGEIKVKITKEIVGGVPVDILVSVVDTGIGIEPDQISTLFSKFRQLREGRANAGLKSSGLGLFIAKGIVEAWGGKIWVESQGTGMGSTFNFTIPIAAGKKEKIDDVASGPVVHVNKVAQA